MGTKPFLSPGQDFIQSTLTKCWASEVWLVALWNLVCISHFIGWMWFIWRIWEVFCRNRRDIGLTKYTCAQCPSVSSLKTKQILRLILLDLETGSSKILSTQQGHCKCWHQIWMMCHYPVSSSASFFLSSHIMLPKKYCREWQRRVGLNNPEGAYLPWH